MTDTLKTDSKPKMFYRLVRGSFGCLLRTFWRFRSVGQENIPMDGPVLLVVNHQSYLDPVACACGMKREMDFMARETLFKGRFGRIISNLNAFPVRRGEADMRAIRDIVDRLEQRRAVVMFPEGTRSADGQVKDFKNGFVLIARKAKAAIVPVAVDGTWDAWPRQRKLPRLRKLSIEYGQVIPAEQVKSMDRDELLKKVTDEVRRLQNKLRIENGRQPYDYNMEQK